MLQIEIKKSGVVINNIDHTVLPLVGSGNQAMVSPLVVEPNVSLDLTPYMTHCFGFAGTTLNNVKYNGGECNLLDIQHFNRVGQFGYTALNSDAYAIVTDLSQRYATLQSSLQLDNAKTADYRVYLYSSDDSLFATPRPFFEWEFLNASQPGTMRTYNYPGNMRTVVQESTPGSLVTAGNVFVFKVDGSAVSLEIDGQNVVNQDLWGVFYVSDSSKMNLPNASWHRSFGSAVTVTTGPTLGEVMLTYTDRDNNATTQLIDVENPVAAPSVGTAISLPAATVGSPYSFTVPAASFTSTGNAISISGLPAGLSANGGVISGTPTAVFSGNLTITATNSTGSASQTPTLTVAVAAPGAGTPISLPAATVGTAYSYTVPASAFSGTGNTISISGLPSGLSASGGVISGTPTGAFTGNITVTATNASGSASQTPALNVTVAAPVIVAPSGGTAISLPAATVGSPYSYTVPASAFNGTSPTISVAFLPAGLSAIGGVISGTPTAPFSGNITITATNSAGAYSQTPLLTVYVVAPSVGTAITPDPAGVGTAYSYTVPTSAFNGTNPTITITGLPAGLSASGRTISGTPTAPFSGTITVTATNAAGSVSQVVALPVSASAPVVVTPSVATAIAFPAAVVGTPYTYTLPATAFNGTSPTITVSNLPAGLSYSGGVISGTPTAAFSGNVTITATNASGSVSQTPALAVTAVTPVNNLSLSNGVELPVGEINTPYSFTIPASLFVNPDGGPLTYVVSNLPSGLTGSGLSITGSPLLVDSQLVTVTATDQHGNTITARLPLTINNHLSNPLVKAILLTNNATNSASDNGAVGATPETPTFWARFGFLLMLLGGCLLVALFVWFLALLVPDRDDDDQ